MGKVWRGPVRSTCRPTASASSSPPPRTNLGANHGRRQLAIGAWIARRAMMQRWIRILVGAAALMIAALPVLSAQQIDMAQRQQEVRARERRSPGRWRTAISPPSRRSSRPKRSSSAQAGRRAGRRKSRRHGSAFSTVLTRRSRGSPKRSKCSRREPSPCRAGRSSTRRASGSGHTTRRGGATPTACGASSTTTAARETCASCRVDTSPDPMTGCASCSPVRTARVVVALEPQPPKAALCHGSPTS